MIENSSLYGYEVNTQFTDIWDNVDDFLADYQGSGIAEFNDVAVVDDQTIKLIYFLLYGRYGNSSIASSDRNRFKYGLFSTIFQYAPTWIAKLELQDKLRKLKDSDLDLTFGGKAIYNHAYNPGNAPGTNITREIPAINEQNVTIKDRDKLTAYATLYGLLENDVTEEFLNKFKKHFMKIVAPAHSLWYEEEM